jgi:ubiquinone/menaquinone biosynthesis C-methylase UbiE
MDERRVAEFYDGIGSSYDQALYFQACDPLYRAEIAQATAGRRFRRILDLGCGTGKQTILLAPHAEEVWAIDLSGESLRQAERRCRQAGVQNVKFLQQSIIGLPAEDGSVEAVFSYGDVISHVYDAYEQVFRECGRVLAPDGLMGFEVDGKWELDMLLHNPVERGRARAARGVGHLRIWRDIPCKTFTAPELRGILERVGLRVVRTRGVNIFHCLLPEAVLFGLPQDVGSGWRLASSLLQRVDTALGTLSSLSRLASTRLVTAVKR